VPHPIDTLLVHLKDTLNEFGVSGTVSADIGATVMLRALEAIYFSNPATLMQNYESKDAFLKETFKQGLRYEQWIRPQLGMPQVRSFAEEDEIIAGLATHLGDLVLAISVMKDEFRANGVASDRWFAEVNASVLRASKFLHQFSEEDQPAEPLPPTRFEREPVL
jgi:hypothetical protein